MIERFRDELGDWRIVLHSPYGAAVHAPWALVIAARMRERYGVDVAAMHADDGIVLRLPDVEYEDGPPDFSEFVVLDPQTLEAEVTARDRRRGDLRGPLPGMRGAGIAAAAQADRQASAALAATPAGDPAARGGVGLPVVPDRRRGGPRVPVRRVRRARPGGLMRELEARTVRIAEVTTPSPSPFASSLLFGYVAQFLYEGDSPLAERRAAALTVDPTLLAELLGHGDGLSLRDLLDPNSLADIESELQRRRRGPARPQPRRDRRPAEDSRPADDHRDRPAELGRRRRCGAGGAGRGAPGDRGADRRRGDVGRPDRRADPAGRAGHRRCRRASPNRC